MMHGAWLHVQAKELVSQGALPTTKDKKGLTPLHYAASHGHKDVSNSSSSTCSDRLKVCTRHYVPAVGSDLTTGL